MTLPKGQAYCLSCLGARAFASASINDLPAGQVNVRLGTCLTCGDRMVRLLPAEYGVTVPEALPVPTRATYSGEGRWDYNAGRYVTADGTQALHKIEKVSALLNKITDSVDLSGQDANGHARWGAIVAAKASASHFDAIVETIMREGFRFSIVMWSPNGDRDGYSNGGWTVGNGHHRLTAAILLGLEYLPVVVSLGNDYMRCDDSSDDENAPIERNGDRRVWSVIRDYLPAQGAQGAQGANTCGGCRMGCECCHDAECPQRASAQEAAQMPATGTATRERAAREALVNRAQAAAGDAVYGLLCARRAEQSKMREEARGMREEIERMIERAAQMEQDVIKIDSEISVLWLMYDKAANITPGN